MEDVQRTMNFFDHKRDARNRCFGFFGSLFLHPDVLFNNKFMTDKATKPIPFVLLILLLLVHTQTELFGQSDLTWSAIAPGVWSAKIGKPDELNFYTVAGVQPRREVLNAM